MSTLTHDTESVTIRYMNQTAARLPRIIQFEGVSDSGEYGGATCPHCGADGRYVWTFITEDGERRGAMAGCIQKFPVSKLAEEHKRIIERSKDRAKNGQKLASWDIAKLAAIEAVRDGELTADQALLVVQSENAKRKQWMDRNKKGGWR